MKIYVAGKITGLDNYKELFCSAENKLKAKGYSVMNPAVLEGDKFTHDDYMHVCYAMIDVCGSVYFINNWKDSKGAKLEHKYAIRHNKKIIYEQEDI